MMEVSAAASIVTSQQPQTFNTPAVGGDNSVRDTRQDNDADNGVRSAQTTQTTPANAGTTETLGNRINVTA